MGWQIIEIFGVRVTARGAYDTIADLVRLVLRPQ